MRFTFEVPGKPVPQGSMRSFGRGRMVHSNAQDLLPWRAHVAAHAMSECPKDWDPTGPMAVELAFDMVRPRSHWSRNGNGPLKPSAPWWDAKRPDTDKLARAVLDALTDAGIWGDDSQVVQLTAEKRYDDDGPGHLTCTITRLTERRGTE